MGWGRGNESRPPAPSPAPTDDDALDTAWRIHAALTDWTGKVDTKAAFCFAVESAVLVAVVNLKVPGRLFAVLKGPRQTWAFGIGVALIILGITFAGNVVMPRLRRRKTKNEWPANFIYFGHLRHWEPAALEAKLSSTPMLPVLSHQLVVMSKIAWRKHVMVQLSLLVGGLGAASLILCGLLG
jgi:hypothetical protein